MKTVPQIKYPRVNASAPADKHMRDGVVLLVIPAVRCKREVRGAR